MCLLTCGGPLRRRDDAARCGCAGVGVDEGAAEQEPGQRVVVAEQQRSVQGLAVTPATTGLPTEELGGGGRGGLLQRGRGTWKEVTLPTMMCCLASAHG